MKKTKVIFKKVKDGYFQNDVIAFFVENMRYDYNDKMLLVGCYEHFGQHGESSIDYMENHTTLASVEEYEALKTELENIGYDLIDMTGWEEIGSIEGYYLYRKIENGKGKWLAEVNERGNRSGKMLSITYEQALGYEPIKTTPIKNLARELGRILLP